MAAVLMNNFNTYITVLEAVFGKLPKNVVSFK